jgi:hypothetical protein
LSCLAPGLTLRYQNERYITEDFRDFPEALVTKVVNLVLPFGSEQIHSRIDIQVVEKGLITKWTTKRSVSARNGSKVGSSNEMAKSTALSVAQTPSRFAATQMFVKWSAEHRYQSLISTVDTVAALNRLGTRAAIIVDPETSDQLKLGAQDPNLLFRNGGGHPGLTPISA